MARKQQHNSKTTKAKKAKAVQLEASASTHKHDVWAAVLTIMSLVLVHVTLIFHAN